MKNIWRIEFLSDLFDCIGCDEESLEKAIEEKDKYYGGKISIPKKMDIDIYIKSIKHVVYMTFKKIYVITFWEIL